MKREVVVSAVSFNEDGIELHYMVLPDDVRSEGHIVMNRIAAVSYKAPGLLGSSTSDLRTSVEALATALLDQLPELPVYEPPATERLSLQAQDDDDEDVGMGDGR